MLLELSKTVSASSTPERLVSANSYSSKVVSMVIQVKPSNTGIVRIRSSATGAGTSLGLQLGIPSSATSTPQSIFVGSNSDSNRVNMYEYFIEVAVDGDGVNVLAERR